MRLAWGARVSADFRERVVAMGVRLALDPSWIMAVMAFESARTFRPDIWNKVNNAFVGLIQFGAEAAADMGTTTAALAKMTAVEQLDFVERYFAMRIKKYGPLRTLSDCYMAVLYPPAIGKAEDAVIFHPGSKQYLQNKGLDIDHDGAVTKAEAAQFVVKALAEGMQAANVFEHELGIGDSTTYRIPELPSAPPTQREGNIMGSIALPLLAQLIPQVLGMFSQRAQATIAEKTGADPKIAADFMQAMIAQVGHAVGVPVVDAATATQAVAALTAAPPDDRAAKAAALEAQALATIDALLKAGDKMADWDERKWAAELKGRQTSSSIAIEERKAGIWDMTRTLVYTCAFLLTAISLGLLAAIIAQAVTGDKKIDGALIGLAGPIWMAAIAAWAAIIAFRFDGSKQASDQSKALTDVIRERGQA